mmetsp:Transcript_136028/g.302956  ORF Transcript_136028/g.302956 Transcript_136028/m.302956 type:complete len:211 (+) Transcript_136028:1885-2517(+)
MSPDSAARLSCSSFRCFSDHQLPHGAVLRPASLIGSACSPWRKLTVSESCPKCRTSPVSRLRTKQAPSWAASSPLHGACGSAKTVSYGSLAKLNRSPSGDKAGSSADAGPRINRSAGGGGPPPASGPPPQTPLVLLLEPLLPPQPASPLRSTGPPATSASASASTSSSPSFQGGSETKNAARPPAASAGCMKSTRAMPTCRHLLSPSHLP